MREGEAGPDHIEDSRDIENYAQQIEQIITEAGMQVWRDPNFKSGEVIRIEFRYNKGGVSRDGNLKVKQSDKPGKLTVDGNIMDGPHRGYDGEAWLAPEDFESFVREFVSRLVPETK